MPVMTKPKKTPKPRERKGKNLNVWIRPSLRDRVDEHIEQVRPKTNLTGIVEAALEEYFERHPLPPDASAD